MSVDLFLDANNDGALTGAEQTPIATQTNASGAYSVGSLPAGNYRVTIGAGLPGGLTETYELDRSLDGTAGVTLGAGQSRVDVDFGYTATPVGPVGSIGDLV